MNKIFFSIFVLVISMVASYSQTNKDTLYIRFNEQFKEMRKVDFTRKIIKKPIEDTLKKSLDYYIEQMEPANGYPNEFNFTHVNYSQKAYNKFGGKPPAILKKHRTFLNGKKVLDIDFFRRTSYGKVTKTFEEEDSWEQDVMIFMVDMDEIKNDTIVLREVNFSRPVKQ